jgi:hypothetical protein
VGGNVSPTNCTTFDLLAFENVEREGEIVRKINKKLTQEFAGQREAGSQIVRVGYLVGCCAVCMRPRFFLLFFLSLSSDNSMAFPASPDPFLTVL